MKKANVNFQDKKALLMMIAGVGLVVASLMLPGALVQWRRIIEGALENSIWQADKGLLMLTAARVVAHNALLMLPPLCGALMLAHGLSLRGYKLFWGYALPAVLLNLVYLLMLQQLNFSPPLAIPLIVTALWIFIVWRSGLGNTGLLTLSLIPALLVLAVNSLAVSPYLASYGLAKGNLTWETVLVARFLHAEVLLNATCMTIFFYCAGDGFGDNGTDCTTPPPSP